MLLLKRFQHLAFMDDNSSSFTVLEANLIFRWSLKTWLISCPILKTSHFIHWKYKGPSCLLFESVQTCCLLSLISLHVDKDMRGSFYHNHHKTSGPAQNSKEELVWAFNSNFKTSVIIARYSLYPIIAVILSYFHQSHFKTWW